MRQQDMQRADQGKHRFVTLGGTGLVLLVLANLAFMSWQSILLRPYQIDGRSWKIEATGKQEAATYLIHGYGNSKTKENPKTAAITEAEYRKLARVHTTQNILLGCFGLYLLVFSILYFLRERIFR